MKLTDIIPVFKKDDWNLKATTDPSVFFQTFQKFFKKLYLIKSLFLPSISSQNTNVALEKALVPTLPCCSDWEMLEKR